MDGDLRCPTCAEPVQPGDQFCEACGNDLPADVAAAQRPAAAPIARDPEAELLGGATSTTRLAGDDACACGGRFDGSWCDTCGARRPDPRDHQEVDLGPVAAVASDKGHRYARNEDAFALEAGPQRVLAVVCDGVGSTVDPELASAVACDAALTHLRKDPDGLVGAHRRADAAVRELVFTAKPDLGSPSCTFLAAVVEGTTIRVASLGDCRAYWVPDAGGAEVLTDDDSWARAQVRAGVLSWEQARADRRASVITRWLGEDADPGWEPEVLVRDVAGDGPGHLLLCSDGLWNYLPTPTQMGAAVAALAPGVAPLDVATTLVDHALAAGGHDNVTVLVVRLPLASADAPDQPTDPEAAP